MENKKQKIAISISDAVLREVDRLVDGVSVRSRSQAIEMLMQRSLASAGVHAAVLLLKKEHQKLSATAMKQTTLLDAQIHFFTGAGIREIYILTQPGPGIAQLKRQCASYPISIQIFETQEEQNADALKTLKSVLKQDFVVMSGDTYNAFDLSAMIEKHRQRNVLATMGLLSHRNPDNYGSVRLDGDLIIEFREKSGISHIINAGVYVFKPDVFRTMKDCHSLELDLFPKLAASKQLLGHFTMGEYVHVSEAVQRQ